MARLLCLSFYGWAFMAGLLRLGFNVRSFMAELL